MAALIQVGEENEQVGQPGAISDALTYSGGTINKT